MPFRVPDNVLRERGKASVRNLAGDPLIGNGNCAVLPEFYTAIGLSNTWREGAQVRGHRTIQMGTAVATFENGRYQNRQHGNHAALYVSQDATGITIIEQFIGLRTIQERTLPFLGRDARTGRYIDSSNNGDAFSIIEH